MKKLAFFLVSCLFIVTSATAQIGLTGSFVGSPATVQYLPFTTNQIKDASANLWTVVGGVIYENASLAGFSANVIQLTYYNNVMYQENASGQWYSWTGSAWTGPLSGTPTPGIGAAISSITASPSTGTVASGNVTFLVKFNLPVVVGGTPTLNLNTATSSAASYTYGSGTNTLTFTETLASGYTANPVATTAAAVSLNGGIIQTNGNNAVLTGANSKTFTGLIFAPSNSAVFTVSGGDIIGPNGQRFIAEGINIRDDEQSIVSTSSAVTPLLTFFPSLNFVRLAVGGQYDSGTLNNELPPDTVASLTTFINQATAQGIVVEIELHDFNNFVYTSTSTPTLSQVTAWYSNFASAFNGNPYVWFGTPNEPGWSTANGTYQGNSTQDLAVYNAIRATGNNTIVMLAEVGGGNPPGGGQTFSTTSFYAALNPADYSSMTNVVWDLHFYSGNQASTSTTQSVVNSSLSSLVTLLQSGSGITSANGAIPVMIGEFGNSISGNTGGSGDANGVQVVAAVLADIPQITGYAAWLFYWPGVGGIADNLVNQSASPLALTTYGTQVAAGIAAEPTFWVAEGHIIGPNGAWKGYGVAVSDTDATSFGSGLVTTLQSQYPGISLVRLSVAPNGTYPSYTWATPANLAPFVNAATAAHIVVVIENHDDNNSLYTGSGLTTESAWYASVATYYLNNPYVLYQTMNEPAAGDSAQMTATYNAIRGTGNNNIVFIEAGAGAGGISPASTELGSTTFTNSMTNVAWDLHCYPWQTNGQSVTNSVATIEADQNTRISTYQAVTSANGLMPVITLETGISTTGTGAADASGNNEVTASFSNTNLSGASAWAWDPYQGTNSMTVSFGGALNSYGTFIAGLIASEPSANATSANYTTVPSASRIVDAFGNLWTITSGAQMAVNGTTIGVTAAVAKLAYVNGVVWQLGSGEWYSVATVNGATTTFSSGTTTSPLPNFAVPLGLYQAAWGDAAALTTDMGGLAPTVELVYMDQTYTPSGSTGNTSYGWVGQASYASSLVQAGAIPAIAWPMGYSGGQGSAGTLVNLCTQIASGTYDNTGQQNSIYGALAAIKANGFTNIIVRPGWEMNGGWYPWSTTSTGPLNGSSTNSAPCYVAAFQHMYTVMHTWAAANGMTINVAWNPNVGDGSGGTVPVTAFYPGNAYVDSIAIDDYGNGPFGSVVTSTGTAYQFTEPLMISMAKSAIALGYNVSVGGGEIGSTNTTFAQDMVSVMATANTNGVNISFFNWWDSTAGGTPASTQWVTSADGEGANSGSTPTSNTVAYYWYKGFGVGGSVINP